MILSALAASPMKKMVLYSDAGFCFLMFMFTPSHHVMYFHLCIHRIPLGPVQRRHGFNSRLGCHSRGKEIQTRGWHFANREL